jgi:hypothetical protein
VDPGCKRRAERDATKRAHLKIEKSVLGTSDFADFTEYKQKNKTPRTKNSEKKPEHYFSPVHTYSYSHRDEQ